jgi:nicotinate-nucleotide adenylyltransferase
MNIGLYFGSFNPIHIGHLIIANFCATQTNLEQVWFVLSPQNPLKNANSLLNEYHRLHMLNAAIEDDVKLKTSKVEFNLPKPSYTIDTLTYLKEQYPQHQFNIIMGSDSFQNLDKWKNYEQIVKNHTLYIYNRPGFVIKNTINANIVELQAPLLNISSTHIRKLVKEKKSIRFLVPDVVEKEIAANNYYK